MILIHTGLSLKSSFKLSAQEFVYSETRELVLCKCLLDRQAVKSINTFYYLQPPKQSLCIHCVMDG